MRQPIRGAEIHRAIRACEARLAQEPDRVAQLRAEILELRNSLSWKVTAPLRVIAAPLMRRR